MADVDEIIGYLRSLKRGFDKDEFQLRVEQLAYVVDNVGLDYEEFHTLFKLWLNLCIPVTKWSSVGACLVPRDRVEERTVEYALRWLLANYQQQTSYSRIGFLLDWLTAAMDSDSIDTEALDVGYEVFYMLNNTEILTPHAMKLVYNLTKPVDVTRRRVVELIDIAKKRDAKKSKCRQIQVLLGLFKSYKPEYVPESIPAFSIHTAFRKLNVNLVSRFGRSQAHRNSTNDEKQRLLWVNPINSKTNKKAEPLVPNMEFVHMGSKQYTNQENEKNFFDFTEPSSLLEYSLSRGLARPARLRALLCNAAGVALLATAPPLAHAFLEHDLDQLLEHCFLHTSPYSYPEKSDLLWRLASLQRTLMQGLPVVTRFLAAWLPTWNVSEYFHQVLALVEWISVESPSHARHILLPLGRVFHSVQPLQQLAILNCLVNLYSNLAYASSRKRQYFLGLSPSTHCEMLLSHLAVFIADLCGKALQVSPDDMRPLYWSLYCSERVCRAQLRHALPPPPPPPPLALALPLLHSAPLLDKLAGMLLLYKQIFGKLKKLSATTRKTEDLLWTLQAFTEDLISCLWGETILANRASGVVFTKMSPKLVELLQKTIPNADGALSLRSHIAFGPYTYSVMEARDYKKTDNKLWFDTVIEPEFSNLSRFLKKAIPELKA